MILSKITQKHIEQKLGVELRYPSDYEHLTYDIERLTKRRIGLNTIKRLFGAIESTAEPRLYTLDAIAVYLGYNNWDSYIVAISREGNSKFAESNVEDSFTELLSENLITGQKIEFQYFPDRVVVVEFLSETQFRVLASRNSKLKTNDIFDVKGFYLNYPLIIQSVYREGFNLGRFTAGEISGLTHLELVE